MKHLIICREYPPASYHPGGIGTYVNHISQLLAEHGETVHVITQMWGGAPKKIEEKIGGRLVIHRLPLGDWETFLERNPYPPKTSQAALALFRSDFPSQCFSWQACLLAEALVEQEAIDIIEAQEWEAPLYYFQLRRALGFGPKRRPPCIVHLHSPTEFIVRFNDLDIGKPEHLLAKRLEDYSIGAADAWLCPSQYLAKQSEAHYGMANGTVRVIPYPMGETPLLKRGSHTWERGSVCFVGRLERRKGIIEWIDAAVTVAPKYPFATFDFVGANVLHTARMSGDQFIQSRIPEELKGRFVFHGTQKRSALPHFLVKARIAVVPSRWENFPNTCIEAMSSGLPVIVSPDGGMAEMIKDGATGWLASNGQSGGLAEALIRALETPPEIISEMGSRAATDIREMCSNKDIVQQHLAFREEVVSHGSIYSVNLPPNLPWAGRPLKERLSARACPEPRDRGLAIVVTVANPGESLDLCLERIKQQTRKPVAVIIADTGADNYRVNKRLNQAHWEGWEVVEERTGNRGAAKQAAITSVFRKGLNPSAFVFLDPDDRLEPEFVATCESVLFRCPEIGILSCWIDEAETGRGLRIKPCPAFPYQWVSNDADSVLVLRTEALQESGHFRSSMPNGLENWDVVNAVMAADWIGAVIPEILVVRHPTDDPIGAMSATEYAVARRELLERFPSLIARDAKEIALQTESAMNWGLSVEVAVLRERLTTIRRMVRSPRQIAFFILRKVKHRLL
ncbi:MAG TPA: glycosyltransferase, partial [Nitrospira sp.]|nr:glycosyltransferase [Nitrospira sp.]